MSLQYRLLSLAREILRSDILRQNKQGMSGPALRFVIKVDLLFFKELTYYTFLFGLTNENLAVYAV